MKEILKTLIGTSKGWLFRQALKWGSSAGAAASAVVITHASKVNIDPTQAVEIAAQTQQIAAGATGLAISVGVAIIEGVLSKKASKIAAK
jgi:hypothetical protein